MVEFDPLEENDGDTVFRDVIFLALAGFVAIVMLLLPHLNPPAKAALDTQNPGNVVVELRWPDDIDVDVDLWVEAPGDRPVGYSNKGGRIFNLLRDDLGRMADISGLNYEISYSRGRPSGEYTINAHVYRNRGATLPIIANLVVSLKAKRDHPARRALVRDVILRHEGEEVTIVRFSLDEEGKLLRESVHDLPRPLRTAQQ